MAKFIPVIFPNCYVASTASFVLPGIGANGHSQAGRTGQTSAEDVYVAACDAGRASASKTWDRRSKAGQGAGIGPRAISACTWVAPCPAAKN